MLKNTFKLMALLSVFTSASFTATIPLYSGYLNATYMNAKNAMMANATTATTKGYSSMLSNPAGMSTNYNAAVYLRTVFGSRSDSDANELPFVEPQDHVSLGVVYDNFGIEVKSDDYIVGAGAYGLETKYGLFSAGMSYLKDTTDLTKRADSPVQSEQFATGDYLTYGVMWQKSFIDEEGFYAVYFGLSHKNSGKYEGENTSTVVPVSPSKTSYGFGLETNVLDTTLLVTLDLSEEYWQSIDESLSGMAYGFKWMINQKFALAAGYNQQTFNGSNNYSGIETIGLGIEFGFLGFQTNTAFTQRLVDDIGGDVFLTETALHFDVAFTF